MRERHWKSLMEDVGKTFDPHADGFTLEIVLELELEHHSDIIADLSQAAHASQSQTRSCISGVVPFLNSIGGGQGSR